MKNLLYLLSILLPWPLRRRFLQSAYGYQIHPTARIGLSLIRPRRLIMEEATVIGHFTVAINLDLIHLRHHSRIGRGNWITGMPPGHPKHFLHQPERRPEFIMGEHSAVTNRHLIDCTARVTIGRFATFAGFQSQILTHSIDLEKCRQSSEPVAIGDYCFVGTNCVILGGSVLPDYAVLAAKSQLAKKLTDSHALYSGVPARFVQELSPDFGYFRRTRGVVD
jgi:acetyltransferase-like isoleucine patch superfamily enzyme